MWWLSDGIMLVCNLFSFLAALLFLFFVGRHRTCRNLSVILVANTCCAGLIATSAGASQAISMLFGLCYYSDQCVLTAYFYMVGCAGIYHSLCLQALHRLISNILTTGIGNQHCLRSSWCYAVLLIVQWIISFSYLLPFYNQITFIPGSCLCQISLTDIPSFFTCMICIYFIPLTLITISYVIIWQIHMTRVRKAARQSLIQRQNMRRELTVFKRIFIPLVILFVSGFPYVIFFIHARFVTLPVPYAQRIAALIVAYGWISVMFFNLISTNSVKEQLIAILRRRIRFRQRQIQCVTMQTGQRLGTGPQH